MPHPFLIVALLSSSVVSIFLNIFIIVTYFKYKRLRQHPNGIIIARATVDTLCYLSFFSLFLSDCKNPFGRFASFLVQVFRKSTITFFVQTSSQFTSIGAEFYFLMLSIDIYISLTNPFTNVESNLKRYHFFALTLSLASAILLLVVNGGEVPIFIDLSRNLGTGSGAGRNADLLDSARG